MLRYYSIYDNQLQQANPPFFARDDKSAIGMVRNMLLSADDDVFKRVMPVCDLVYVGTFDSTAASFDSTDGKTVICSLADIPIPDAPGGTV